MMKAPSQSFRASRALFVLAMAACSARAGEGGGTVEGTVTGALAHTVDGTGSSCAGGGEFSVWLEDSRADGHISFSIPGAAPAPGSYPVVPNGQAGPGKFGAQVTGWSPVEEERSITARGGTLTLARVDSTGVAGSVEVELEVGRDNGQLKDYATDTTPDAPPMPARFSARFDVPLKACGEPSP